ncbi:MAG: glycosyltransferase family 2 protein [Fimbriimonadaceae bacterium]|jgi:hypothetical protein|nr:glycosyltransferase family 2 protein [Fimbriimonadaceae bacterium]
MNFTVYHTDSGIKGLVHQVTVILVSYNTVAHVRSALTALRHECYEVIVVDNASRDGTVAMIRREFPWVKLIENEVNRGFGPANNQGLAAMNGQLALFLNSDAVPEPGAIHLLAEVFQDKGVVAAGGRLSFPDGSLQNSCCNALTLWAVTCEQFLLEKAVPRSRVFSPYWVTSRLPQSQPTQVHQVMGACLMIRPIELFDERFFLYAEDTELCHRLGRHGKILYQPLAKFTHALGASSVSTRWESVARYNRGKELFFEIHYGKLSANFCWFLNRLGAMLRLGLWGISNLVTLGQSKRFATQTRLWIKVLFAPKSGPPLPSDAQVLSHSSETPSVR